MCIQCGSRELWARTVPGPFRISGTPLDGLVVLPGPSGRYTKRAAQPMPCWSGLPLTLGVVRYSIAVAGPGHLNHAALGEHLSVSPGADNCPGQHETFQRNPCRRNNMYSQRVQLSLPLAADRLSYRKLNHVPSVTMPFEKEIFNGCSSPFLKPTRTLECQLAGLSSQTVPPETFGA